MIEDKSHKIRNESLDTISGIMILWMIVYHSFQWASLSHLDVFKIAIKCFFFFMSWFYFKSGFVFKLNQSFREIIIKGTNQLLIPMIIWSIIGYFLSIPEMLTNETPVWKIILKPFYKYILSGDTLGNLPLWYLSSLFFVRIIVFFVLKFRLVFTILIISVIIGWTLHCYRIILPLGLSTIPLGVCFYLFGIVFRQFNIINYLRKFTFLIILISILTSIFIASYIDFHTNSLWFGNYWMYIVNSLLTISASIILFRKIKIFSWIGKYSLFYLILHWPIFTIVKFFIFYFYGYCNGGIYMFILCFISILFISITARYIPERFLGINIFSVNKIVSSILKRINHKKYS